VILGAGQYGQKKYGMWDSFAIHSVVSSVDRLHNGIHQKNRSDREKQLTDNLNGVFVPFNCGGSALVNVHWSLVHLFLVPEHSLSNNIYFYDSFSTGAEHEHTATALRTYINTRGVVSAY
jgi:hypothetical protein